MPPVESKATATEKALAAEKAEVSRSAAAEAATSVADAVKKVADAAVAAVQKTDAQPAQDFRFAGTLGGRFTITGNGFGTNGTVKIGGTQAVTNEWGDALIVGKMPDGAKAGLTSVEVAVDSETVQRGSFRV